MLQKEFEALTGRQSSAEEFKEVNRIYMAAENMDKQAFCRAWTEGDFRTIAEALADTVERSEKNNNDILMKLGAAEERAEEAARQMLLDSDKYGDDQMKESAHRLVGDRLATKMALELGCSLNQKERDLLLHIME